MRVATSFFQQQWLAAYQRQQAELARTQLQVSTGQRVLRPSDDPVAAARILGLDTALERNAQYQDNADAARNRLSLEESALGGAGDLLQRVRELALQANNATQSAETRAAIAVEIRQLGDELLRIANSQDGGGQYLFAGYATKTEPFARAPTGVSYLGDQGQRLLQVGPAREIADGDPGSEVFQLIPNGNGAFVVEAAAANAGTGVQGASSVVDPTQWDGDSYSVTFTAPDTYEVTDSGGALVASGSYASGASIAFRGIEFTLTGGPATGDAFAVSASRNQDVFATLDRLAVALESGAADPTAVAVVNNEIARSLQDIDQAIGRMLEVRASVGARLKAIENQTGLNADFGLELTTTLSEVRDLDYAEAVSRLNLQLVGLQAAQQAYVQLQGLSLFNYL
jgi:flagellar hook-associated protein 3 FlgL